MRYEAKKTFVKDLHSRDLGPSLNVKVLVFPSGARIETSDFADLATRACVLPVQGTWLHEAKYIAINMA